MDTLLGPPHLLPSVSVAVSPDPRGASAPLQGSPALRPLQQVNGRWDWPPQALVSLTGHVGVWGGAVYGFRFDILPCGWRCGGHPWPYFFRDFVGSLEQGDTVAEWSGVCVPVLLCAAAPTAFPVRRTPLGQQAPSAP